MAKSKYESHVAPRLEEIKDWCRNGATDEQIYNRLGISRNAFYEYQKKHREFYESLKYNKEYCDGQIENALFEAAKAGNVTAQIFWLKNRRPKVWREKPEENDGDKADGGVQIIDDIQGVGNEYEDDDKEADT